MIMVALGALGLILGSFVNALVWRFYKQAQLQESGHKKGQPSQRDLSMTHGRSMCSHCHHELAPKDLIPLFSWLWLRGKCRYCHRPIEDNPLIEVVLPLLFVVSYLCWPMELRGIGLYDFGFWLVFLTGFLALAAYDLRWYLLPDRIVFPLFWLALLQKAGEIALYGFSWSLITGAIWGVLIASGIFYALFMISDGSWIGGGDVKLGLVTGLLLGGPAHSLLMIFLASLLGTAVALPLMAIGRKQLTSKLPFGPYLLAATVIVILFGSGIIHSYYDLIDHLANMLMV